MCAVCLAARVVCVPVREQVIFIESYRQKIASHLYCQESVQVYEKMGRIILLQ